MRAASAEAKAEIISSADRDPLNYLIGRMIDETAERAERDACAIAALPYLHPRLSATTVDASHTVTKIVPFGYTVAHQYDVTVFSVLLGLHTICGSQFQSRLGRFRLALDRHSRIIRLPSTGTAASSGSPSTVMGAGAGGARRAIRSEMRVMRSAESLRH
jgi:hypothetical protein